ncbi:MAG: FlgO family outer membrane protein [Pseudomonadota bacterium]
MKQQPRAPHAGLRWPDDYRSLLPAIQDQWAFREDIYLSRKLSGGKSGALVYAADIAGKDFTGQAILKFDLAPEDEDQWPSESDRHVEAYEVAPEFAASHLPKLLHALREGEKVAVLSTIAGRGLEYAEPWVDCDFDGQLKSIRLLSDDLLEEWNRDYTLSKRMYTPQELLRSWLGDRLDPPRSRLDELLSEACGVTPTELSFTFEGHWYPNPLVFATMTQDLPDRLRLRAVSGHSHGDLHGQNILVGRGTLDKPDYYLIDLAAYESDQFLFFDHAYFELAYLLRSRQAATPQNWDAILDRLSHFHHQKEGAGLKADDLGPVEIILAMRRAAMNWVDRHESHRLSYMESQYLLARVAAALNFANKRISDETRSMAILYGASCLLDYLKLNNVDWPRHGPRFKLSSRDDMPEFAIASSTGLPAQDGKPEKSSPETGLSLEKPAIAVLAFDNLSDESDQEYFADGIADEVITELSHIDWLTVISRGSTFSYRGQSVDAKQISRELGAQYVVEGTVRKSGDRIRVNVRLVDARSGHSVWADRFDGQLEDIFRLQEDIAEAIAGNIDGEVRTVERERARRKASTITLWDKLQRGLWHFHRVTDEDREAAIRYFDEVNQHGRGLSTAHAALALVYTRKMLLVDVESSDEDLERGWEHATKAVALDQNDSFAHVAMARVYMLQLRYESGLEEAETAIALNPSSSFAHFVLGAALAASARASEAVPVLERSIQLSPRGPFLKAKQVVKAFCHYFLGELDEAERLARAGLGGPGLGPFGHTVLCATLVRQNRLDDARKIMATILATNPDFDTAQFNGCWREVTPVYTDAIVSDLRKAGLP